MSYPIPCPACAEMLYFPQLEDAFQGEPMLAYCGKCQFKYGLTSGRVLDLHGAGAVPQRQWFWTRKSAPLCRYRLRLGTGAAPPPTFELSLPTPEEGWSPTGHRPSPAALDDRVSVLYTLPNRGPSELVRFTNHTQDRHWLLGKPGQQARSLGQGVGVGILVSGGILASLLQGPIEVLLWLGVLPTAFYGGRAMMHWRSPRLQPGREQQQLAAEQKLLGQIFQLQQRLTQLRQETQADLKVVQRLEALKQRMVAVAADLYSDRIARIENAVNVLNQQLGLSQSLIDGYAQALEMLQIEFETSRLVEQLPDDLGHRILSRLEELKAIEAQRDQINLRVDPAKLLGYC